MPLQPLRGVHEVLLAARGPRSRQARLVVLLGARGSVIFERATQSTAARVVLPAAVLADIIGALVLAETRLRADDERRCRARVLRMLAQHGQLPASRVRQWTTAHHARAVVERVLGQLVEAGDVVLHHEPGRGRMHRMRVAVYSLATSPGTELRP